ncbi:MAG: penicillin-binding protein 2 [Patescibacteria group bacterium]
MIWRQSLAIHRRLYRVRHSDKQNSRTSGGGRVKFLALLFVIFAILIVVRLFYLQVLRGGFYAALALGQHELYKKLFPERGSIYVIEDNGRDKSLFPLVTNRQLNLLYAVPAKIANPEETAQKLFEILGRAENIDIKQVEKDLFADISPALDPKLAEEIKSNRREKWHEDQEKAEIERLTKILSKKDDPYEPIRHRLTDEQVEKIRALKIEGLDFSEEAWRFYPEKGMGGHIFGFLGFSGDKKRGQYGLEGYYDKILSGQIGEIRSARDVWGDIIAIGRHSLKEKVDGSSLVLTIDRAIQYKACQSLYAAVDRFKAEGGSVMVMNPKTGAIIAMCGAPDYDPDQYNKIENINVYNNPAIFNAYEPGSIFKVITMAAALDAGKIEPETAYIDTGSVKFGPYTIKNFNDKIYGQRTMTEVLENSINTGAIWAMEQATAKVFTKYVKDFGFGQLTDIGLEKEAAGDIANLDKKGEIYPATASFGQGIAVTPLQMLTAYAAIANGGKLMKPYIVSQIINDKNEIQNFYPQEIRQVISSKTSTMLSAMLVSVVESGHGKTAQVPGYRVGGKTGTAQVPRKDGRGYSSDVDVSFVGFAPFADPKFVMIVVIFKPQYGKEAVVINGPVFADIAKFILQYYNVPQDK